MQSAAVSSTLTVTQISRLPLVTQNGSAFNAIGFNASAQASSNATINQVTSAYQDISNTFDPGGRIGQLMFRLNW